VVSRAESDPEQIDRRWLLYSIAVRARSKEKVTSHVAGGLGRVCIMVTPL